MRTGTPELGTRNHKYPARLEAPTSVGEPPARLASPLHRRRPTPRELRNSRGRTRHFTSARSPGRLERPSFRTLSTAESAPTRNRATVSLTRRPARRAHPLPTPGHGGLTADQRLCDARARASQGSPPAQRRSLSQGPRADDRSELEATLLPASFHCK